MQSPDEVYRSFTSFRMTGLRFVVILSGAKDLYATSTDYIISIPPAFREHPPRLFTETCGMHGNVWQNTTFNAAGQRNVQILRFAQDDKRRNSCHPERSEGSVRIIKGLHSANPPTFREEPFYAPSYRQTSIRSRSFFPPNRSRQSMASTGEKPGAAPRQRMYSSEGK